MIRFWFITVLCVLGCKAHSQSIEQITDESYWGIVEDFTFTPDGSKIIIVGRNGGDPSVTIIDTLGNILVSRNYNWFPGGMDPGPSTFSKVVCDTNGYFYVSGYKGNAENYWPESFLARFNMQGDSNWFYDLNEHKPSGAMQQGLFIEDNFLMAYIQHPAAYRIFDISEPRPLLKKIMNGEAIQGYYHLGDYRKPRTVFRNDSMIVIDSQHGYITGLNKDTIRMLSENTMPESPMGTRLFGFDGENYYAGRIEGGGAIPPPKFFKFNSDFEVIDELEILSTSGFRRQAYSYAYDSVLGIIGFGGYVGIIPGEDTGSVIYQINPENLELLNEFKFSFTDLGGRFSSLGLCKIHPNHQIICVDIGTILTRLKVFKVTLPTLEEAILIKSREEQTQKLTTVAVYPNPTEREFVISSATEGIERIEVYSLSGQLQKEVKLNNVNQYNINPGNSGIYILRVHTKSNVFTNKVIKL